ncbi:MAG: LamG domain-containing protein [Bacteroidota bacterium]
MNKIYWILIVLFVACAKAEKSNTAVLPDIVTGKVIDIALDGSVPIDAVSNKAGIPYNTIPATNRHNEPNRAMLFNAADSALIDFGDLEAASFTNHQFTISCWVYLTDTTKPCAILSKRSAFGGFEYSIDNHFKAKQYFSFDNWIESGTNTVYGIDPFNASAPVILNSWQHLVFVGTESQLQVYINGVLQNGTDQRQAFSFSNTDKHFVIGNGGGYGKNYFFNGAIDDIKIYNKVLDLSAIQVLAAQ